MRRIVTISLLLPYKLGSVNCYLIETDTGYILIDTGCSNKRTDLEKELKNGGCKPDNLKLIVLTHGDFDHTGNAAFLREKFSAKICTMTIQEWSNTETCSGTGKKAIFSSE